MDLSKVFGMFAEPDGKASFSRIASAFVVIAWLTWVSYIVFTTRALPTGMWEVSTVVGSLYSLNKVTAAITGNTNG